MSDRVFLEAGNKSTAGVKFRVINFSDSRSNVGIVSTKFMAYDREVEVVILKWHICCYNKKS